MTKRKKGTSRFARGLLIYVIVFVLLAAAVLTALSLYLRAYEASRSTTTVRSYMDSCAAGKLGYGWGVCLAGLDTRLQTEADTRKFIQEKMANASFRELLSETENEKVYAFYDADGVCFDRITLSQTGETEWGFTAWELAAEECDVSAYTHSLSVTVPLEYTVCIGDTELDSRFIVDGKVPYTMLEDCSGLVSSLPTKALYEAGPYLFDGELRILDAAGKEVPADEQDELHYLDNCSKIDQDRLGAFARTYLDAYLPYAGDLYRSGLAFWENLYSMTVHGGELEERLVMARKGFGYGNTNSVEILSDKVNLCCNLKDGHYLVDYEYLTETVGLHGPVDEENRVRLLIQEVDGQLYTEAMYHY